MTGKVVPSHGAGQVHVRHSPFRLDPLNDRAHVSVDTIHTGGLYPQATSRLLGVVAV